MLTSTPSNQRGETLVELLVATFILSAILFLLLSIFISNRQGIQQSWSGTGASETAVAVIEHIKATPDDVFQAVEQWGSDNRVMALNLKELGWDWTLSDSFKDYDLEVDLYPYLSYPPDELIEVVVRVKETGKNSWNQKVTLLRNEAYP